MNTNAYLERIGYSGSASPTLALLQELQTLHVCAVPYENLDILLNRPLSLELADIYKKVVEQGRGGYCFELNGLFAWLLRELGFTVAEYLARFLLNEPEIPMRRHRVLAVQLPGKSEDRYLCDVGVGIEVPRLPLLLQEGLEQVQNGHIYGMTRDSFLGWVLNEQHNGTWRQLHAFTLEPQLPKDFVMPSFYCEKHRDSIFNKQPMLSLKTPTGRKTLDGLCFKEFSGETVRETQPDTVYALQSCLLEEFQIELNATFCEIIIRHCKTKPK